jgi:GNAT superfamily N-acetyltransferase
VQDATDVARIYIAAWNAGFAGLVPGRATSANLVERWRQELARPLPQRWWTAQLARSIVGFAGIGPSRDPRDPELGELDTIAVDPGKWRRGVGRSLMKTAVHQLAADGYREAVLWTFAGYERGHRFYEATGWRLDGGVRDEGRQLRYRIRLAI